MKRGGQLRRTTPLRRSGTVRSVSAKREAERDAYATALELVERRDRGVCLAAVIAAQMAVPYSTLCKGRRDPHHVWPTGRGGPRCDPDNIVTLCRWHHDWVHDHPTDAVELGLLRREW